MRQIFPLTKPSHHEHVMDAAAPWKYPKNTARITSMQKFCAGLIIFHFLIALGLAICSDNACQVSGGYLAQDSPDPGSEVSVLEVKWVINTSDIFTGLVFGAGYMGCQTVWDVDGDGVNEIVFGTGRGRSNRLWCFDAFNNFEWVYPPIDQDGLPGDPTSKVSLVDVDNNGVYELCIAGRGGRLHALDGLGSVVWTWDNPDMSDGLAMNGAPQAMDVDGDGFVEFFLNDNQGHIYRVNHRGEQEWVLSTGGGIGGHPTICDVDRDGLYEVLCVSTDTNVYCMDADTGAQKWLYITGGNMASNNVIVMDVNDDGEYEVIVWNDRHTEPGSIYCLNSFGIEIWRWVHPDPEGGIRLCQAVGDVDGDGGMDMAVMSNHGMFCLDISGVNPHTLWRIDVVEWSNQERLPPGATSNDFSSYQLIADIDGDGGQEVLWLAPFPIVTDAATGELEAFYSNDLLKVGGRQENGAWWGDVDGDGVSEWIVELNGNTQRETLVYCLTMNGEFPAMSPWPEYYHTAYPRGYQNDLGWLALNSAGSNSLWFPIPEIGSLILFCVFMSLSLSNARRRLER